MHRHASLNHAYRLVWNEEQQTWVAVAETTPGKGKAGRSRKLSAAALSLASALLLTPLAHAAPQGGQVTAGSGSISQAGTTTTITQASQNLSLTWQSFNVGAQESVNFVQPSASAIAVNRILDTNGSQILGALKANGQVWLINPNGILFGQSAQVNVGGLVASTLDLSDASLASNTRSFSGSGTGSITNQGSLTSSQGGYIALLGNSVSNQGQISAPQGTVALGAGSAVTLTFADNSLIKLQVDQSTLDNLAHNGGLIQADGGMVLLSAGAKDSVLASMVNNSGVIEARTVENRGGTIVLMGGMTAGTTVVDGTLDASAPNGGNGGFIETSAAHVKVADSASITTAATSPGQSGTWLIDPVDFTIAASGGDMTGATLGANLGGGNVTIQSSNGASGTAGNVNVNDAVSWSANKLTLNAQNNININAAMSGTGTASLALEYGQGAVAAGNTSTYNVNAAISLPAGNSFSTKLGSDGTPINYTVITSVGAEGSATGTDLQGMSGNLAGNYALGANIDASATSGWNAGAGFMPVGNGTTNFAGRFNGLGHTISNLNINRPGTNYVGLFGYTTGATISNVGLLGGSVIGGFHVGGLAGENGTNSTISNSYTTGSVGSSRLDVGGLVGFNSGTIGNSYATGSVNGSNSTGGLVGNNGGGTISNSYATGSVSGYAGVGGLVGFNSGTIGNSYATGSVSGYQSCGGLAGSNLSTISNSYATGSVSGGAGGYAGGLVGDNGGGTISNSYAAGRVSGSFAYGGLVGGALYYPSTIINSYWDSYSTGQGTDGGGGGATAVTSDPAQSAAANYAFKQSAYAGLDFSNTWYMVNGSTRPFLRSEYSTIIHNAHQLQLMALNLAASYTLAANIDAGETGTAASQPAGMWSGAGFVPVGDSTTRFTGSLDGLGHTISGLTINRSGTDLVGLFGYTGGATISNVGLLGVSINGHNYVGALAGFSGTMSTIRNSYVTGSVSGLGDIGALVGVNSNLSIISNSYANSSVNGSGIVGGLVGSNSGGTISNSYATGNVIGTGNSVGGLAGDGGTISNSYATGNVSGGSYVGGLAGNGGSISNSYATGNVSGTGSYAGGLVGYSPVYSPISNSYATGSVSSSGNYVGGLVGRSDEAISSSYATGSVSGTGSYVGGLVGYNSGYGNISNSYAMGSVSGSNNVGGLVGFNDVIISNSYAMGSVSGTTLVGGLAGVNSGTISNSYWNTDTSGQSSSAGGIGLSSAQMMQLSSFSGWNIAHTGGSTAIWRIYEGHTAPLLRSFMTALTLADAPDVSVTYNGTVQSGASTATAGVLGAAASGRNAGFYNGYYSTQQGYDISGGNLTIATKALALSGITATDKVYDGNTTATLNTAGVTFSGLVGSDTVTLGGSAVGAFANKNVGTAKTVTVTGYTLGGADASNYTLGQPAGLTASITPRAVTVSGITAANKTYDGTTSASVNAAGAVFTGLVGGDTVTASATGTFSDKNVGVGKTVNLVSTYGGADAGNYTFASQATTTANISPKALSISGVTASDKIYDGNTIAAASMATATLSGLVGGDVVNASGIFADRNVGAAKAVTLSYGGADAGNYSITGQTSTTASITPATLSYAANLTTSYTGLTPSGLGGTVTGFVGGDTQASATSGTLVWSTPATASSLPGQYAINGSGLTASSNYVLVQAAGNASALTIQFSTPPQTVINQMTSLQSNEGASAPADPGAGVPQPGPQSGTFTLTPGQGTTSEVHFLGAQASAGSLQIVRPGILLPMNTVLVGE